jgi:hypothetical protein
MTKEQIKKLEGDLILIRKSINLKWKPILYRGKVDHAHVDCFLCHKHWGTDCFHCPVFVKTKEQFCCETPYVKWADKFSVSEANCVKDKKTAQCAVNMINFLIRLERGLQKKLKQRVGELRLVKLPAKWRNK